MKQIKKIFHIADVHIRNLKRHKEYTEVFNRLYDYIKSEKDENSIIVLAGDIVHAKTDMTPEVVDMTQNFLKSLSDILPTILISGCPNFAVSEAIIISQVIANSHPPPNANPETAAIIGFFVFLI